MHKFLIIAATLMPVIATSWAADKPGSADIPDVGRYEGSEIEFYEAESYGATTLATGPVQSESDAATTALTLEGEVTRIVYKVPPGASALEVFRNFEGKVSAAGYQAIFSGGPEQINDYIFHYKHPVEIVSGMSLSNEIWYLSAKKSTGAAETHISLLVSPHSGGDGQRVRLIAVTSKVMENRMIDAAKMQSSLIENGKIALYGIYFDTDSATVQPSSAPTLQEIAKLLQDNVDLNIIVVGHTDNQGSYDYNLNLSQQRAAAVSASLTSDYAINAARLKDAGVGYLAPAASNDDEAGRGLNRRVELVRN